MCMIGQRRDGKHTELLTKVSAGGKQYLCPSCWNLPSCKRLQRQSRFRRGKLVAKHDILWTNFHYLLPIFLMVYFHEKKRTEELGGGVLTGN